MRRTLTVGAVLSLALIISAFSTPPTFSATPKVNATCTKVGQIKLVGAKRLICSRVGGKKIWRPHALPTPTPSSTSTTGNLKPKLWFDDFEPLPESAKVYTATLGASCPQEGLRAYVDDRWTVYVCAVKATNRALIWQQGRAIDMTAGAETGGIYLGEICRSEGETRGVQNGTFVCARKSNNSQLEWAMFGTPPIFADWQYMQAPAPCGPRLETAAGEYYRIYKRSFAIDPRDSNIIWAVVEKIGAFISTDAGRTWRYVSIPVYDSSFRTTDGKTCMSTPSIHFGTGTDRNTYIYNPSGPGSFGANKWVSSMGIGFGVYVTPDNGKSWNVISPRDINTFVTAFAVDPSDSKVMYWAHGTEAGSFNRRDGSRGYARSEMTWLKVGFIDKSIDGGKTWRQLATGLDWPQVRVTSLHINPSNPKVITATLFQHDSGTPYMGKELAPLLIRSTDGGETWTDLLKVDTSFGTAQTMSFTISPDQQQITVCSSKSYPIDSCWISKDAGKTFTRVAQRLRMISANPNDSADLVGYGTVSTESPLNRDGIYRSRDGGLTWTRVGDGPSALLMDAAKIPETVSPEGLFWHTDGSWWLTGGGGLIFVSRDSGATWKQTMKWEDFAALKP